jgi:hypothetical protein
MRQSVTEPTDIFADMPSNDYHQLPVTEKQMIYARQVALRTGIRLPEAARSDRRTLSDWISAHQVAPATGRFSNYPSSKQVAFAERIARLKRRNVPDECFRDRGLMSKWIDHNR